MALKMQRAVVVFPQPLSPTRDSVSPWLRKNVTSSTAFTRPTVFWRRPLRMGKYFFSPFTSRSTDLREPVKPFAILVRPLVTGKESNLPFFRRRQPEEPGPRRRSGPRGRKRTGDGRGNPSAG